MPVNGQADFGGIPIGDHTFVIEDLSANCTLVNDPTQPVTVLGGQIQPLAYPVTCTAPPLTGPNLIAFQSDRDGFTEIYTMNPDGTHQTRVTEDELVNMSPSFAPDGQTIAFVQSSDERQRYLHRRRRRLGRDHSDGDRRWRPILPGRPTPAESRFSPTRTSMEAWR